MMTKVILHSLASGYNHKRIKGDNMLAKVKAALEKVRPSLQADGGDVEFVELTPDNIVKVRLTGACGSCPMATMTLKMGIEKYLKKEVPEIKSVEQAEEK